MTTSSAKRYPMPFVRIELVILGVVDGALSVLLAKRAEEPYAGAWALPGGVLRIDQDSDLDAAASRVAQERLNTSLEHMSQLRAVGGKKRDPRAPWSLSVVYRILLRAERLAAIPGKRIDELKWHPLARLPAAKSIAFDHMELIENALQACRSEAQRLDLPLGLLDEEFTLGELQSTFEALLGRPLDKSSFRRRLADRDSVVAIEGATRGGANRPAQLYRVR
jgi:ADP-ribose pyrophosphatase YjhB (NUDIX family)